MVMDQSYKDYLASICGTSPVRNMQIGGVHIIEMAYWARQIGITRLLVDKYIWSRCQPLTR